MQNYFGLLLLLTSTIILPACGKKEKSSPFKPSKESCEARGQLYAPGTCFTPSGVDSKTGRFSLLTNPKLLEVLDKETVNVCLLHESQSAQKIFEVSMDIEKSFHIWQENIADLTPFPKYKINIMPAKGSYLPETSEWFFENCAAESDIKVSLQHYISVGPDNQDREHANAVYGTMFLNDRSDYAVVLHEMGHLFGLADVYVEDVWSCKSGFSNSVMCDHAWEKPVFDDIEAVRRSYCLASEGANPSCYNSTKDSLFSFYPSKLEENETLYPGMYFSCESTNFYFGMSFNYVFAAKRDYEGGEITTLTGPFWSLDSDSIKETFEATKYRSEVKVNLSENDETRDPLAQHLLNFEVEGDEVYFSLRDANTLQAGTTLAGFRSKISDCYFDKKFVNFLQSKGVSIDEGMNLRTDPALVK